MDVSEWQRRLERYFTDNGKYLKSIISKEKQYGEHVSSKYPGQFTLMSSFFNFYVETLQVANKIVQLQGWPQEQQHYPPTILYYIINFRSLRATENLLLNGYPFDGYALLRDIKDRAIFLSAIAQGHTTLKKMYIYPDVKTVTEDKYRKVKNEIKAEEHRILNHMIRKNSGFEASIQQELDRWELLFHEEVHGSKFSFFIEGGSWLRGEAPLTIGPIPNENAIAMYFNRVVEISWLLHRMLPYLQLKPRSFGPEWAERWSVLDDSFRIMVQGLKDAEKNIAKTFVIFIDKKFPFSPDTFYYEDLKGF